MVTWMVSRCVHIAGVGLVSLPCTKVSADSKKLKASGTTGSGIGHCGRMASRSSSAKKPTAATAIPRCFASRPKTLSRSQKQLQPSLGHAKDAVIGIRVRQPSSKDSEIP